MKKLLCIIGIMLVLVSVGTCEEWKLDVEDTKQFTIAETVESEAAPSAMWKSTDLVDIGKIESGYNVYSSPIITFNQGFTITIADIKRMSRAEVHRLCDFIAAAKAIGWNTEMTYALAEKMLPRWILKRKTP
jgi:hypothetical protein